MSQSFRDLITIPRPAGSHASQVRTQGRRTASGQPLRYNLVKSGQPQGSLRTGAGQPQDRRADSPRTSRKTRASASGQPQDSPMNPLCMVQKAGDRPCATQPSAFAAGACGGCACGPKGPGRRPAHTHSPKLRSTSTSFLNYIGISTLTNAQL